LFHCNFDYSKLPVTLPSFYKECILTWASLNCTKNPSSVSEISQQFLWNNRFILIDSHSSYNPKLIDAGYITVRDLFDSNGNFRGIRNPLEQPHISPVDHFLLFSLFNAIPEDWRKKLKLNRNLAFSSDDCHIALTCFSLYLDGKVVNAEKPIQFKLLYEVFLSKISSVPTATKKFNEEFNSESFQLDWERIFSLPFKITLDTKLREFQFKILHRICYTNVMLFKFGFADSPLCYFCNEDLETPEHLFFGCRKFYLFWSELNTILRSQKLICTNFDIKDILFGHFAPDNDNDNILLNYTSLHQPFIKKM